MDTRELDARVAREVMGLDGPEHYWTSPMWENNEGFTVILPNYSTDMNAAIEVVDVLQSFGWYLSLESPCRGKKMWEAYFTNCNDATKYHDYNADTPALAICLAALEAVDNKEKK